jgi:DNA-binding CsgD family transcriptional regulator
MSKAHGLTVRNLRCIYMLMGECREIGPDQAMVQQHLLTGLCHTVGGSTAAACVLRFSPDLTAELLSPWYLGGPDAPRQVKHLRQYVRQRQYRQDPLNRVFYRDRPPSGVRLLEHFIPRPRWLRSALFNEYCRPTEVDQCAVLSVRLRGSTYYHLSLHRSLGECQYSLRELRMLRLVGIELGALLHERPLVLSAPQHCPAAGPGVWSDILPPRMSQVLELLLDGASEKEVARRLDVSRHTVHGHVKMLHQRFGASSRGELLARARELHSPAQLVEPGAGVLGG